MKFKKRYVSLIAVILCTAMLFSGCTLTSKKDSSKNNSSTEAPAESLTSAESEQDSSSASDDTNASQKDSEDYEESAKSESTITPAVWEVTDADGNIIYMMGSIHVADKDASVLPDYFESAYAKCDSLAVECDITDVTAGISEYQQMMYTDGTTIKDHVSEESYNKVVELLKNESYYTSTYDYLKPIVWVELIELVATQQVGLSDKYGVDTNLIRRAKKEGKEILEVESVEFQYNLLFNLSEDIQNMLFEDMAQDDAIKECAEQTSDLYDKWKAGTMTEEDAVGETDEDMTEEEKELLEEYNQLLLYDRNAGMADKAMEYMKDGRKVMFVVGSAHFYGNRGILKLMENAGCTVRRLPADDADIELPNAA